MNRYNVTKKEMKELWNLKNYRKLLQMYMNVDEEEITMEILHLKMIWVRIPWMYSRLSWALKTHLILRSIMMMQRRSLQ